MTPAQAFYNLAMLPGWQKWKPTYRYGTITGLTGSIASVTLEEALSSQQDINVNQSASLEDVPIEYMTCDGVAFEEGDEVLIKFEGQDFGSPKIIGFKDHPRRCPGGILLIGVNGHGDYALPQAKCVLWDTKEGKLYEGAVTEEGDPITFPCDRSDLDFFLDALSPAEAWNLFEEIDPVDTETDCDEERSYWDETGTYRTEQITCNTSELIQDDCPCSGRITEKTIKGYGEHKTFVAYTRTPIYFSICGEAISRTGFVDFDNLHMACEDFCYQCDEFFGQLICEDSFLDVLDGAFYYDGGGFYPTYTPYYFNTDHRDYVSITPWGETFEFRYIYAEELHQDENYTWIDMVGYNYSNTTLRKNNIIGGFSSNAMVAVNYWHYKVSERRSEYRYLDYDNETYFTKTEAPDRVFNRYREIYAPTIKCYLEYDETENADNINPLDMGEAEALSDTLQSIIDQIYEDMDEDGDELIEPSIGVIFY